MRASAPPCTIAHARQERSGGAATHHLATDQVIADHLATHSALAVPTVGRSDLACRTSGAPRGFARRIDDDGVELRLRAIYSTARLFLIWPMSVFTGWIVAESVEDDVADAFSEARLVA